MNINGINKATKPQQINNISTSNQNISELSVPNKVNISEQAKYLDMLSDMPAVRQEKIDAMKIKMQSGSYKAQMEDAMIKMLQDL